MKKHPVLSFGSCTQVKMSQNALNAILLHHELCNGTGYPIGLQKNEIPLSVRILTFCDVFDAITSERPYAQKESSKEALNTIESEMQKSLDMSLFDDFAELVTEEACV
jgi:HD-GYP domain-containing protein (c-di-GMP phosphodiesterase class II)